MEYNGNFECIISETIIFSVIQAPYIIALRGVRENRIIKDLCLGFLCSLSFRIILFVKNPNYDYNFICNIDDLSFYALFHLLFQFFLIHTLLCIQIYFYMKKNNEKEKQS